MSKQGYSIASRINLNNGLSMPRIHLGVYLTRGKETSDATKYALKAGYTAIDSAAMYHNEKECGEAILAFLSSSANTSGLKREDIHFTSKLASNNTYAATRLAIKKSLAQCGLDYLDLYLLHSPYGGTRARLECWRAVEDAVVDGEIKSAGVSNFGINHLQELLDSNPKIIPAINQIEVHPFNTQTKVTKFCQEKGIVIQAYAPLARALKMKDPKIVKLSKTYRCTPGQLMIRWSIQHGFVPLPKSVRKERIEENAEIGGFEISGDDMKVLDGLDEQLVTDWDPVNTGLDN